MANYSVTDYVYGPATATECAAYLETTLETIDTAKTVRLIQIIPVSRDRDLSVAVLIIDA